MPILLGVFLLVLAILGAIAFGSSLGLTAKSKNIAMTDSGVTKFNGDIEANGLILDAPMDNSSLRLFTNDGESILVTKQDGTQVTVATSSNPPSPSPENLAVYVSGGAGSDVTGDGTISQPYQSLGRAIDDVRSMGWDVSAEIRILVALAWPQNIYFNVGTLGKQAQPLVIRGYNTNPNPGRTTVFSDTIASAVSDPISGILDITANVGGFTSDQIGQYLRFTSGQFANYPFINTDYGSFAVDVVIVDVLSSTSLRLAFSTIPLNGPALPLAGDAFVIESIDTVVPLNQFSTLSSNSTIKLQNLAFDTSSDNTGLVVTSSTFLILEGVNFLLHGSFLLTGYDGATIMGGAVEFFNASATGFTPNSASLFVNAQFGSFSTCLTNGTQNADVCLGNMGIIGPANFTASGLVQSSYFGASANVLLVNEILELGYSWLQDSDIQCSRSAQLNLPSVHIVNGNLSVDHQSNVSFDLLAIEHKRLTVTNGSRLHGDALNLVGNPSDSGPRLDVSYSSIAVIDGHVALDPTTGDGMRVIGGASLTITGDFDSSGQGGVGVVLDNGSLFVTETFNANINGSYGLQLSNGSVFQVLGAFTTSNNSNSDGVHCEDSEMFLLGSTSAAGNGGVGIYLSGSQFHAQDVTCDSNDLNGFQATNASICSLTNLTCTNNSVDGVFVTNGSQCDVSTALISTSNTFHGFEITNGSKAILHASVTVSDNNGNGADVNTGSEIVFVGGVFLAEHNGIGIYVNNASTGFVANPQSTTNNSDVGVRVGTGSTLQVYGTPTVTGTAQGDVIVGVNASTTWANITARDPAFMTDYLSAQNPTQLCSVSF